MSDAAIPLSFHAPAPDIYTPLDAQAKRLSLQQMAQSTQLNEARIREEQLKAQALDEQRRDNETIRQGYSLYPGDLKKVREHIASKVNPIALRSFDTSVQEHAAGLAKMDADTIAVARDRSEQLARHLDAVGAVKRGDNSPEATAARAAEWAKQVTLAKSKNLDPENQISTQYPGDDALPVLDTQLRGSAKHLADEEARRKAETEALTNSQKRSQIANEQRQESAGILAAAAGRSPGDYIKARAAITDPALRAQFPDVPDDAQPTEPLSDEFVGNLRSMGMKPHEQATTALTKQQRDEQVQRDADTALWRSATGDERRRHDMAVEAAANNRLTHERGQTATSRAVDRRQWERELNAITEEEESATAIRTNIENALNSGGKLYVDDKGKTVPMSKAAAAEESTADALTQQMRGHYKTLTNRLKRITADKNNFGEALGMQIGVPTTQVHAALDADMERVMKPPQGTATPTAAPAPTPTSTPKPTTPAAKPTATPAQPNVGQRFSNGKTTVKWDGQNYIDEATGKPAVFK